METTLTRTGTPDPFFRGWTDLDSSHTLDLKNPQPLHDCGTGRAGTTSAVELNIRMALGNGATKEEVLEAMIQMAPYAGFPAAWEGLRIASSEEKVE